jgi:ABC-2 type transport system permease protein
VRSLRVFLIGGWLSYRALFRWLQPSLYVMVLLIPSVTQMIFFVYLGRAASVENDAFYVVGNALVACAVPCLFAMSQTIAEERFTLTLPALVVSPANRVALFLGRAFPSVANGAVVATFALVVGATIFGITIPLAAVPGVVLAILVVAFSCTGIGLVNASLGLRWRETGVLSNLILYFLLLFAGVNVPLDLLPGWAQTMAQGLPITHGAEAARDVVAGSSISDVAGLLGAELLVGVVYAVAGLFMLRRFEVVARRNASLEVA